MNISDRIESIGSRLVRPRLFVQGVNSIYSHLMRRLGVLPDGIEVMEQDWDNLIILDACRYDAFVTAWVNRDSLPGTLQQVRSQAPHTNAFLRQNVGGKDLTDTVYVTSSPHLYKANTGKTRSVETNFAHVEHVWQEEDGFKPSVLTERALTVAEEFPNKRLVAHMIPPHQPYYGPSSDELESILARHEVENWRGMVTGEIEVSDELIWKAYAENLTVSLDSAERLLKELRGKTVITPDHGQLLGDREFPIPIRGYGHPTLYIDELLNVPWLECEYTERREILSADSPESEHSGAEEEAREALRDLGYLND